MNISKTMKKIISISLCLVILLISPITIGKNVFTTKASAVYETSFNKAHANEYYYSSSQKFVSNIAIGYGREVYKDDGAFNALNQSGYDYRFESMFDFSCSNMNMNNNCDKADNPYYVWMGAKQSTGMSSNVIRDIGIYDTNAELASSKYADNKYNVSKYTVAGQTPISTSNGDADGVINLNMNANGDYLYAMATKDVAAGAPIIALDVSVPKTKSGFNTAKFINGDDISKSADLNKNAGGDYIYLHYKKLPKVDTSILRTNLKAIANALNNADVSSPYYSNAVSCYNAGKTIVDAYDRYYSFATGNIESYSTKYSQTDIDAATSNLKEAYSELMNEDIRSDGLRFGEDGKFKIVVFADCQDDSTPDAKMMKMINESLDYEKPDLVVFTGDNVVESTASAFKKGLTSLLQPLVDRDIPYAFTFGNHDAEFGVDKLTQYSAYRDTGRCLTYNADDSLFGFGNCNLPIYSSNSEDIAFNLWMIDSNMYNESKNYDNVHQDQLDWFTATDKALEKSQGHKVNSIIFQHIIMPECVNLLVKGSVSGVDTRNYYGATYSLKLNEKATGYLGEFPCPPAKNGGEFNTLKSCGDVLGVVTGHDHSNSFIGTYDGIDFIQTPGMTFASYGDDNCRGYRVIELDENNTSTYSTHTVKNTEMQDMIFDSLEFNNDEFYYCPPSGTYVSDIAVEADSSSSRALSRLTSAGYTPVDFDLNKGARGNYIFMGYKTTSNYNDAIKDIRFYSDSAAFSKDSLSMKINEKSCEYSRVGTDLNVGSGGDYIYFMYSKDNFAGPAIRTINFSTSESMQGVKIFGTIENPEAPADLNKNTNTHENAIYCYAYTTQIINLTQLKNYRDTFKDYGASDGFTEASLGIYQTAKETVNSFLSAVEATRVTDKTSNYIKGITDSFVKSYALLTTLNIDNSDVWGFAPHTDAESVTGCFNSDCTVTAQTKSGYIGTGSTITVEFEKQTYVLTAIVFGDVNGDSWYDGMDSVYADCISNELLGTDALTSEQISAADCNHDGVVDVSDVEILQHAGVLLQEIDQTKSAEELMSTSSAYVDYVNLISQNPIQDEGEKPQDKTPFINIVLDYITTAFFGVLYLIKGLFRF